jgi:hypothetical protein
MVLVVLSSGCEDVWKPGFADLATLLLHNTLG